MTSSTSNRVSLSTEQTTSGGIQVGEVPKAKRNARSSAAATGVENAVYAYIRALRALGRTSLNTNEVADALALPIQQVNIAISSLKAKGVRKANG